MKKENSKVIKSKRAFKIEILEKLTEKLMQNGQLAEAENIKKTILVLKEIDEFDSDSNPQEEFEEGKAYIASVSNFIRENCVLMKNILFMDRAYLKIGLRYKP